MAQIIDLLTGFALALGIAGLAVYADAVRRRRLK